MKSTDAAILRAARRRTRARAGMLAARRQGLANIREALAMRSFGIFLIVMGVGSAILPYLGMQFIVVAWIDLWGSTIGWVIRGAMVVVGLGLIGLATRANGPVEPPKPGR